MQYQGRSKRKFTGGRRIASKGKRKLELGREAAEPHLDETRRKNVDTLGGNRKVRLLRCNMANVTDPSNNTTRQVSIENVVDNESNKHYIRRNILSRGGIVSTEIGNARITSRPGQDGVVNAVLIKE
ncbi:MAG: 30S ribosomal protein S8e [Methanosarcinales archaeon]|jgi:small subunit ribosomal protein S8e|nr:30S ribosomal protein S8e [Methanosarcinales archaeon]MCD4816458.1 30S ribosomal protein S8e [Methanosarcinales archaeon]